MSVISLLALLFIFAGAATAAPLSSYTFWYGPHPPVDLLSQYDKIIVEADNLNDQELKALKQHGGKVLAYLSIGEWNPKRKNRPAVSPSWVIGGNGQWESQIMDLAAPGWQQYLLNWAEELGHRGFQGFFLDTLDSFMIPKMSETQREAQRQGLVRIIKNLKERNPDSLLVGNRGFEVMDRIAPYLTAVAAESLYEGWNNGQQQYLTVPENDRNWLKKILSDIHSKYGLDIVVLDYLPPRQREKARLTAKKIARDGFIPWVANPSLDYMGIGIVETMPRKVLFIYDSRMEGSEIDYLSIHRLCAPVFEYLGYIPEYVDLRRELPRQILKGRYVGAVGWMTAPDDRNEFKPWLQEKIGETLPVVLLGDVTILLDRQLAELTGLNIGPKLVTPMFTDFERAELIGFEAYEPGRVDQVPPLTALKQRRNETHLRFKDRNGNAADLVVTGDWGGYAINSALLDRDIDGAVAWVIDPFAFFRKALKLPVLPVPDMTTENGRRLLFIHVDGDGFVQKFETPGRGVAAQVLLENIFSAYPLPHTISIIEGEIHPDGDATQPATPSEILAQKIFALPNVEIAAHSYSNPAHWGVGSQVKSGGRPQPLSEYQFDLKREILGSVNYINSILAPSKKQTALFLWTGDCLPTREALAMVSRAGLLSLNGGNTKITKLTPSLSNVSGMGKPFADGQFQTYAPVGSEILYTNNWTQPLFGYRRVVETFQLTARPRRLKPINIHYHFFSGSKYASLKALKHVYDWAIPQETMPIYASDYVRKVLNYRTIGIARKLDGGFRICGLCDLKTLRLDKNIGWPQENADSEIAGWRALADGIYLHIGTDSVAEFSLGARLNTSTRLYQANGRLNKWHVNRTGEIDFRVKGNLPVILEVAGADRECSVRWQGGILKPQQKQEDKNLFAFPVSDTGDAVLECKTF